MDPEIVVLAAGIEQRHAHLRIGAQAIGEQAAGRAGADDDIVEWSRRLGHRFPSLYIMDESGQSDRGGPRPLAAAEIRPKSVRAIRFGRGFNLLHLNVPREEKN